MDVVSSSPANIDMFLYDLWLRGFSVKEATVECQQLQLHSVNSISRIPGLEAMPKTFVLGDKGITPELLRLVEMTDDVQASLSRLSHCIEGDTSDQFQVFEVLLPFLCEPTFSPQQLFQLSWEVLEMMIIKYYEFDENFARAILGHKLTGKINTKEVEDLSCKLGIRIGSCLRQYENFRRVYRATIGEDEKEGTELTNAPMFISRTFFLDSDLAEKYARITFFSKYRIDTTKKRISSLAYQTLDSFAKLIIDRWIVEQGFDFDEKFLDNIRSFRSTILNNRALLDSYKNSLESHLHHTDLFRDEKDKAIKLAGKTSTAIKTFIIVANKFAKPKDVKDILSVISDEV